MFEINDGQVPMKLQGESFHMGFLLSGESGPAGRCRMWVSGKQVRPHRGNRPSQRPQAQDSMRRVSLLSGEKAICMNSASHPLA